MIHFNKFQDPIKPGLSFFVRHFVSVKKFGLYLAIPVWFTRERAQFEIETNEAFVGDGIWYLMPRISFRFSYEPRAISIWDVACGVELRLQGVGRRWAPTEWLKRKKRLGNG